MADENEYSFYYQLQGNEDIALGGDAEMRQICLAGALRNAISAIQASDLALRRKIQLIETALRAWCDLTLQIITAQMECEQEQASKKGSVNR